MIGTVRMVEVDSYHEAEALSALATTAMRPAATTAQAHELDHNVAAEPPPDGCPPGCADLRERLGLDPARVRRPVWGFPLP